MLGGSTEAWGDTDPSAQVVFVGLRPVKRRNGPSDLRRLAEAQQIRAMAESQLSQSAHVPVVGHESLRRTLGANYLTRWLNCAGKPSCVAQVFAPIARAGHRTAIKGEYFVAGGTYHIQLFTFSLADGKLGREAAFELTAADLRAPERWRDKLWPIVDAVSGRVHVVSDVAETRCLIDGEACEFGTDGTTLVVSPGDHALELSKDGYRTEKLAVLVKSESTQEVAVTLKPDGRDGRESRPVPVPVPVAKSEGRDPRDRPDANPDAPVAPEPRPGPVAQVPPPESPAPAVPGGRSAPQLRAVRTDQPPVIDGNIDDTEWQKAPPQTAFTQNFPDEAKPPTERTEMRVLYDDSAVYVAVRCFDAHPEQIVARLTRRDRDIEADKVTVDISSKNDHTTAYHFEINAAGRQLDGTRFGDTDFSTDWDGIWYSAARRDSMGWSAEFAIPLITLRYSGDTSSFGFQVRRYLQRRQEVDEWAYVPRTAKGEVSYYGELRALDGLNAKRLLQIAPYDSRSLTVRTKQAQLDGTSTGGNYGADVKLGLTSGLTLDATINPDFGTVEVDQVVLNLSTIETFFPEKRPFFLEGADLFSTPFQLFYSRRIGKPPEAPTLVDGASVVAPPPTGQILGAIKLTGILSDKLSIGALDALTSAQTTAIQRDPDGPTENLPVDPTANFGVLRLVRQIGDSSSLGVMATSVNRFEQAGKETPRPGDVCPLPHFGIQRVTAPVAGRCTNDAYTAGLDFRLRTSDQTYGASGQLITSVLDKGPSRINPDASIIKPGELGWGFQGEAGKYSGEHLLYALFYSYMGPTLEINDAGFNGAANDQLVKATVTLRSTTPVAGLRDGSLQLGAIYEDIPLTGAPNGRFPFLNLAATLPNFWTLSAHLVPWYLPYYDNREPLDGGQLEEPVGFDGSFNAKTDTRDSVIFSAGSFIQSTLRGMSLTGNLTVNIRPASNVELDVITDGSWTYGDPRLISTTPSGDGSRTYLFRDRDSRSWDLLLRGTWTFSPALSLQVYTQLFLDSGHYGQASTVTASGLYPRLDVKNFMPAPEPDGFDSDFRDSALNVNAFFRWEFLPGSALWLVYTRSQANVAYDPMEGQGRLRFDKLGGPSTDVFLVKLSYLWEPLKSR